jgi:hypothetical protein
MPNWSARLEWKKIDLKDFKIWFKNRLLMEGGEVICQLLLLVECFFTLGICVWRHDTFSPWASMCEAMIVKVVQ